MQREVRAVNRDKLFPYVVPSGYIENVDRGPAGFIPSIGHEVYVMLVEDMNGVCRNVQLDELSEAGLDVASGHQLALDNLQTLARSPAIHKGMHEVEGSGQRFVVWEGHWLAASCIRLPGIGDWAKKALGVSEVCASIPQRESLLFFPKADRKFRDHMRGVIRSTEKLARKQVTFELFTVADELRPLVETA